MSSLVVVMTGQNSHLNIGNDQIYPILYNGKVWVVTTAKYLENNDLAEQTW